MGKHSHAKKHAKHKRQQTETTKGVETCPSFRSGHLPNDQDVLRWRTLTAPHVESFDYFIEKGLSAGIEDIEPAELDLIKEGEDASKLQDATTLQFWVESVSVAHPSKPLPTGKHKSRRLLPRECRERRLLYAGTLTGNFCYRMLERRNGSVFPGKTHKLSKTFGDLPIMVGSTRCHLQGKLPAELVRLREEVGVFCCWWLVVSSRLERYKLETSVVGRSHSRNLFINTLIHAHFFSISINSIRNLVDISLLVALKDAFVCYRFPVETTQRPFSGPTTRIVVPPTRIWALPFDVRDTMEISRVLPIRSII